MENEVMLDCERCGHRNRVRVDEQADETAPIRCAQCGGTITRVGNVHAAVAQQAAGIGPDELSDDHVPLGGPPFGETN